MYYLLQRIYYDGFIFYLMRGQNQILYRLFDFGVAKRYTFRKRIIPIFMENPMFKLLKKIFKVVLIFAVLALFYWYFVR